MTVTAIILISIGIFLVYISYILSTRKCPPPVVKYRFIPRTLKEEMQSPVKMSEIYNDMFSETTVFIGGNAGVAGPI